MVAKYDRLLFWVGLAAELRAVGVIEGSFEVEEGVEGEEDNEFEEAVVVGLRLPVTAEHPIVSVLAIGEALVRLARKFTAGASSTMEMVTPFPTSEADPVAAFITNDLLVVPRKQAHALSTLWVGKPET